MHSKYSWLWTTVSTVPLVVSLIVVGVLALPRFQALAVEGPGPLPTAFDLNPDPDIFETVLVALEAQVGLGISQLARAQTFNAITPGPAFRLKVGDRVIVHFANFLPEPASIHWHGIELDNASDGTGLTQNPVRKGELFTYKFIVPRPGIFFYHSHIMPTNPEFKGYYGPIIVADPAEQELTRRGVLPSRRRLDQWPSLRDLRNTITLVVGDTTVCKAPGSNDTVTFPDDPTLPWAGIDAGLGSFPGLTVPPTPKTLCETPRDNHGHPLPDPLPAGAIPNIQPSHGCNSPDECRTHEGQLVLTNGQVPAARDGSPSAPGALAGREVVFPVLAGDGVRLQLASATATRYLRLRMTDQQGQQVTLFRIGGQGGLLDRVRVEGGTQGTLNTKYARGEILLPVAAREDVVFVPRGQVGDVMTLWTLDYSRTGQGFSKLPTVPVAHFLIVGAAQGEPPLPTILFTIAEGDPLRLHPAVNVPIESLKTLATVPLLDPSQFSPPLPGSAEDTITITTTTNPGMMMVPSIEGIDAVIFDEGLPGGDFRTIPHRASSRYAAVGALLELTIRNDTNAHHPWHPHGFSIQPVRLVKNTDGTTVFTFDYNEFVDTVDIPSRHSLVYRVRLDDRLKRDFVSPGGALGRWALHCHIFFHAGLGMISELVVVEHP